MDFKNLKEKKNENFLGNYFANSIDNKLNILLLNFPGDCFGNYFKNSDGVSFGNY